MIIPIKPFKVGDKVICIKKPPRSHFQCDLYVTAIVSKVHNFVIYVEENICVSAPATRACYQYTCFKLQKKLSFKTIQHL